MIWSSAIKVILVLFPTLLFGTTEGSTYTPRFRGNVGGGEEIASHEDITGSAEYPGRVLSSSYGASYKNYGGYCRKHSNNEGTGSSPSDFTVTSGITKEQCEQDCNALGEDCYAYEYSGSGNGSRCEHWKMKPLGYAANDDAQCYYKVYIFYPGYCRKTSSGQDAGSEGYDYKFYDAGNKDACEYECNRLGGGCYAYEYSGSGSNSRCEIWMTKPLGYSGNDGAKCYYKLHYTVPNPTPAPYKLPTPAPYDLPTPAPYKQPPTDDKCEIVHRRPIYGTGGDSPYSLYNKKNWYNIVSHEDPFGGAPSNKYNTYRKWKVYAVYYHPKVSNYYDVKVKFDFDNYGNDVTFTLPARGSSKSNARSAAYSDDYFVSSGMYPYGYNADVHVYLDTQYKYDLYGKFYWIELLAYDCYY